MKKILGLLLVMSGLLAGCIQRPYIPQMSPAQSNMEARKSQLESALGNLKSCGERIRNPELNKKTAQSFVIVANSVFFDKDDSPNKITLMSSDAKITEPQKKALLEVVTASQECRSIIKEGLRSFPALSPSYDNFYGEMDIVYANLLSKKITIGQANQEKSKLVAKAKAEYMNGISAMNNQYGQQVNQENQARQAEDMQRRAIAAQYLMNQQSINAAQQMNNQNQLNNQINNNKPVTTNCNRFGNQVNCTSY
jgi:hypothetical protein